MGLYSIFFALLMAPLAQVGLSAAVVLWGVLQVGAMVLLCALPGRTLLAGTPWPHRAIYLLIFVTCVPILQNFKWGQVSVLIVLCIVGALEAHRAGHRTLAATLLALAISTNYYAAIFGLYCLINKEYRLLGMVLLAVTVFLLALPVLLVWLIRKSKLAAAPYAALTLLFLSLPLLLKTSWAHYFVFLPFCQLVLARLVSASKWRRSMVLGLYALIVTSVILSNVVVLNLFPDWREYSRWGFLYSSSTLLLLAAYLWAASSWRGRADRAEHPRKA